MFRAHHLTPSPTPPLLRGAGGGGIIRLFNHY
nr:MAG TPA: hypothetical protein [Caudoviricetes sp.]